MPKFNNQCALHSCGASFVTYKADHLFCSRPCFNAYRKGRPLTLAEFRYRMNLLRSRTWVARTLGCSPRSICREYPVDHIDDLHNGRMVNIGGILAKRCSRCHVTRELSHFYADAHATSGCSTECMICGVNRKYGVDSPNV